jgi:hypothetical protein
MAEDDPFGLSRDRRIAEAARIWHDATMAPQGKWSMDACQDAWEWFLAVLAEEVPRHGVRH